MSLYQLMQKYIQTLSLKAVKLILFVDKLAFGVLCLFL